MRSPTSGREAPPWRRSSAAGMPIERDAEQLDHVAEVEGERAVAHHQLGHERPAEPEAADEHEQVGGAAGQRVGADRAQREQRVEGDAEREQHERGRAAGLRDAGHRGGEEQADRAEQQDRDGEPGLQDEHAARIRSGRRMAGQRGQREHGAAGGQRGGAGERDHAVGADDESRASRGRGSPAARSWSRTRRRAGRCGRRWRARRRSVSQTEATAATSAPVATSAKWTQDGEVDLAAADANAARQGRPPPMRR